MVESTESQPNYGFEATLKEPKILKKAITVIERIVDEGEFLIYNEGMRFRRQSYDSTIFIDFLFYKEAFKNWRLDRPLKIGANLEKFKKILRRVKKADEVKIQVTSNTEFIRFSTSGDTNKNFRIRLMDLTKYNDKEFDLSFDREFSFHPDILSSTIKDLKLVADTVYITAMPDEIRFKGQSKLESARVKIQNDNNRVYLNNGDRRTKTKFDLDYLNKISKTKSIGNELKIKTKTDKPAEFLYSTLDTLEMRFILAPMVE